MKQIQEWLGHSDFSTTANIYAHLDYASKLSSAQAMLEGWAMAMRQHDAIRPKDRVDGRCSGKKEWTDE